jgi:hypothetical protein
MTARILKLDPMSIEEVEIFAIDIPITLSLKEVTIPEYWDSLDLFDGEKAASTLPEIARA